MRVKRVFVEKLFGLFDHDIPLNMDERITIMHAPNGFGKTAILRMIDGLFNSRFSGLERFPFSRFGVQLDDDRTIQVEKGKPSKGPEKPRASKREREPLAVTCDGNGPLDLNAVIDPEYLPFGLEAIEHLIPSLVRVGPARWETREGETLDLQDVFQRYLHVLENYLPEGVWRWGTERSWLRDLARGIDVRFVGAERLVPRAHRSTRSGHGSLPGLTPTVTSHSEELASEIGAAISKYGEVSQSLDRSFPVRLVSQSEGAALTKEQIKQRLSEFEAKRKRLSESGLLAEEGDRHSQIPHAVDDSKLGVLSVYVRDVGQKLSVFDALAEKIDLFKSIINRRFRHKSMSISREQGIVFTTDRGQPLEPTNLSSGEQHELVMLFELLFKVREDSLILIDEPEISLHVAWQEEFLSDLLEMTRLSKFDVLVATHSPQIISDHWDLTVELQDTPELQEAVR